MDLGKTINEIKELISRGRIREAYGRLTEFVDQLDNLSLFNEIVLNSSQFENLQKKIRNGVISVAEATIEQSKINQSLLDLVDSIKHPNLEYTPVKLEQQIDQKLSEQLGSDISKLDNFTRIGVIFSAIGILLVIIAQFNVYLTTNLILTWSGILLIFLGFLVSLILQIKGVGGAKNQLKANKEIIDNLQLVSLNLTKLTRNLALNLMVNANEVENLINTVIPSLAKLSFIPENLLNKVDDKKAFLSNIIKYSKNIEDTVAELELALREADYDQVNAFVDKAKATIELINAQIE